MDISVCCSSLKTLTGTVSSPLAEWLPTVCSVVCWSWGENLNLLPVRGTGSCLLVHSLSRGHAPSLLAVTTDGEELSSRAESHRRAFHRDHFRPTHLPPAVWSQLQSTDTILTQSTQNFKHWQPIWLLEAHCPYLGFPAWLQGSVGFSTL